MAWDYVITNDYPWINTKDTPQIINNTWEFYNYFNGKMTKEAMAGILGNMRKESFLNPGQKQIPNEQGWGLIQWTPSNTLTDYVIGNWFDGNVQCNLIEREGIGIVGGRWLPTSDYPYTWQEFCNLTSVEEATRAFCAERERAGIIDMPTRLQYASEEYEILGGIPPIPTIDDLLLIIMKKLKRRRKYANNFI